MIRNFLDWLNYKIFKIKQFFKWLNWEANGSPYIHYNGYHCGCCGVWVKEEFKVATYESAGEWSDTIGICARCLGIR